MTFSFATVPGNFAEQARKYGTRTLLRDKQGKVWRDHSWEEIASAAGRLRAGLAASGVRAGDRVAILADNCIQWVIVDQAAQGLGAVVVPLYTTSGAEETRHILDDSGARIVACYGDHNVRRILELATAIPQMQAVLAMHPGAAASPAGPAGRPVITIEGLSLGKPAPVIQGSSDELATIIYTSGTTGPSKGVMLTHGNIIANSEASITALDLRETDLTLSFLPVAHSFERTAGHYAVMMGGGTIAYAEGLGQLAQNLLEVRPTVVLTVPRVLEAVYRRVMRTVEESPAARRAIFDAAMGVGRRAARYRDYGRTVPPHLALAMVGFRRLVFGRIKGIFGDRLRYVISGGAPLPIEINQMLAAAEVPIVEGYGLTEASPVVSVNLKGRNRVGTVGLPLSNVEVKTAADGELLVRGPSVMKGYYGLETETRETIGPDGWLHTGDIAQIDGEGFIRITDRKKEIIVLSGGKNVSPGNLEARLAAERFIAQACVIGDRRKHLAALIVPDFDELASHFKDNPSIASKRPEELAQELDAPPVRAIYQRILREFNRPLSDVEAIVAFTLVAQPFSQDNGELTPTLKIRRRVIQDHYRAAIDAMYRD